MKQRASGEAKGIRIRQPAGEGEERLDLGGNRRLGEPAGALAGPGLPLNDVEPEEHCRSGVRDGRVALRLQPLSTQPAGDFVPLNDLGQAPVRPVREEESIDVALHIHS